MARMDQRLKSYKRGEWERRKKFIVKLYTQDNKTVQEVVSALSATGFHVNKRMIMTRIMQWGIGRNHKHPEMCAAIQLLINKGITEPDSHTNFIIRGEFISLAEVFRYFQRRNITDPFNHVKQQPVTSGFLDVRIMETPPDTERANRSLRTPSRRTTTPVRYEDLPEWVQEGNDKLDIADSQDNAVVHLLLNSSCRQSDRVLWSIASYAAAYISSRRQRTHQEPQVHHLTAHGRFGSHMQEGLSLMSLGKTQPAFNNFSRGFDMIPTLFADDHPMSLALLLVLICELEQNKLHEITHHLQNHIIAILRVRGMAEHPLSILFAALSNAPADSPISEQALRALRRMSDDILLSSGAHDWRSLYMRERLCDALYYNSGTNNANAHERLSLRRTLHQAQIAKYGRNARNVLWTQTMVADDYATVGQPYDALQQFNDVLVRAETLDGFGRAKTRFAALQGLGNVLYALAQADTGNSISSSSVDDGAAAVGLLEEALENFRCAEQEALMWFETSSRRLEKIRWQKDEACRMLRLRRLGCVF